MLKKWIIIFLCISTYAIANTPVQTETYQLISSVNKSKTISSKMLYTIATIKSGLNPYLISLSIMNELEKSVYNILDENRVKIEESRVSKDILYIKLYPYTKNYAIELSKNLYKLGLEHNIGFFQSNSSNFNFKEIDFMFDVDYAVNKVNARFNECAVYFKDIKNIYECYATGVEERLKDNSFFYYFKSFQKKYKIIWEKEYK